jgi:alkanesulfonate monooxygenase SsuD/methylene tetrahydromethanopterin reductase-like flavin-dependent oxidoreductase (luciferase family)
MIALDLGKTTSPTPADLITSQDDRNLQLAITVDHRLINSAFSADHHSSTLLVLRAGDVTKHTSVQPLS